MRSLLARAAPRPAPLAAVSRALAPLASCTASFPAAAASPTGAQRCSSALTSQLLARPAAPRGSRSVAGVPGLTNLMESDDSLSVVQAHDKWGFTVNGIHMRGSVLVFRDFTLLWDAQRIQDVGPRQLAMVHMISPKIDLLLVGTGETYQNLNPSLYAYFQRKGISVEPMTTMHAISTFNVLNQEGRRVAAALMSREPLTRDDACVYTPEALEETDADRRLRQALAVDPEKLGEGADAGRLLTDGLGSGVGDAADMAAALRRGTVEEGGAKAKPEPASSDDSRLWGGKRDRLDSLLTVQYGYPGALPPDVPIIDTETAARVAARRLRPQTAEDFAEAAAAKASRRSFKPTLTGKGGGNNGSK